MYFRIRHKHDGSTVWYKMTDNSVKTAKQLGSGVPICPCTWDNFCYNTRRGWDYKNWDFDILTEDEFFIDCL